MKPLSFLLLASLVGLFIGAVAGSILDTVFHIHFFSKDLLTESLKLDFYIIKIEMQLTPASLLGLVVTGYLVIKKG
ncbi:MAG: hypothetical protein H7A24_16365 [Leptospiraceae bacterium]|nr:hypothetical protein [Leptospiraceae bacterium]MCP5513463.1 hypothetical protein [Leptospiraceae bacterium]